MLTRDIFSNITFIKNRIYSCFYDNFKLLIKLEELECDDDNITLEYNVGLEINKLRKSCPNFVATLAYLDCYCKKSKLTLTHKLKDKYYLNGIVIEYVEGSHINNYIPFQQHLRIFLQIVMALHFARIKIDFTHYNLHRGNVIIKQLDGDYVIKYGDFYLQTNSIPIIIDYGRSYTKYTGGHEYHGKGVYDHSCWQHDIYYYLHNTLNKSYPREFEMLLKFYGLKHDLDYGFISQLRKIGSQKGIYRSPDELLKFIIDTFNFKPIYNNTHMTLYKPDF